MSAQRRKRLPTDFFDRLLSNQTDNQINDFLSSLVDEQISSASEMVPEEPPSPPAPAIAGAGYRKGMQSGKIEEAIVTRDEELKEETPVLDEESSWEDLIPRTRQMQTHEIEPSVESPEQPDAFQPPGVPEPPDAFQPPGVPEPPEPLGTMPPEGLPPEVEEVESSADQVLKNKFLQTETELTPPTIDLRDQNQLEPDVRISEKIDAAEEETISKIVSAPPPGVHGAPETPKITEVSKLPEAPMPPPAETSPGIAKVSAKAEEVGRPEDQAPAEPATKPPVAPSPVFLTQKELRRKRMQARWERPQRKPKLPKMAKAVPSITVKPSKLALLDDYLGARPAGEWRKTMSGIRRAALLFLLPAFIAFSLFSWYPMLKGLMLSFLDYQPAGQSLFIGIDNYVRAFQDEMFWGTLWHATGFCVLALGMGFWIPIVLAIFINELRWGKGLLKFLFFLPFLMPTVPAAILWKWMMDQGYGLINALVALLGVADPHIGWLTNPKLALLSLVLLYIWKNTGWAILIYSAALGNIDETIYEEAEIDGASIWDKVRHVTFPALRGVIAVMLIITIINTLQLFTEVYIMTNGGPMNSTEFIATYIYKQAFFNMDIGYASALSILLLIMLLFITVFRLRRLETEGG